jgi:hypothetical protein
VPATVLCPTCRTPVGVPADAGGRRVYCPACRAAFRIGQAAPLPAGPSGSDGDGAAGGPAPRPGWDLLDEAESVLVRMIVGAFHFTLVRVPQFLYQTALSCVPWAFKAARVLALLAVWAAVVAGPAAAALAVDSHFDPPPAVAPAIAWCRGHAAACRAVLWGWSTLAAAGSVWGVLYLRRRRTRRAAVPAPAGRDRVADAAPAKEE